MNTISPPPPHQEQSNLPPREPHFLDSVTPNDIGVMFQELEQCTEKAKAENTSYRLHRQVPWMGLLLWLVGPDLMNDPTIGPDFRFKLYYKAKLDLKNYYPDLLQAIHTKGRQKAKTLMQDYYSHDIGSYATIFLADIQRADAYKVLGNVERLILLDMLRHLNLVSRPKKVGEKGRFAGQGNDIFKYGFRYGLQECQVPDVYDSGNLSRSIQTICERGWFSYPETWMGSGGNRYKPSVRWKSWTPTSEGDLARMAKLHERQMKKSVALQREKRR